MSIKLVLTNLQVALCKLGFFPTLLPFWMKAHKKDMTGSKKASSYLVFCSGP